MTARPRISAQAYQKECRDLGRPVPGFLLGKEGARSYCRFVLPLIHFIPESLTYSVPIFLKRQCDRTPGKDAAGHVAPHEAVQTIMQQLSANGDLGHFAAPVVPGPPASDRVQCIFSASRL
jgi:hypothetical protein